MDFQGPAGLVVDTTSSRFRAGYARCVISNQVNNAVVASNPFQGGAVTSLWFSFRLVPNNTNATVQRLIGLVNSANTNKGLLVGTKSGDGTVLGLCKYDGTTTTQLAFGGGIGSGVQTRIDLQLTNYGASSTITVYANGTPVMSFSGDCGVSGVSSLDTVALHGAGAFFWHFSEMVVADEDTRALSLVTMAPTGLGTTDQWTGTYTDVNETANSDVTVVSTNTVAQDEQFNVTDFPTGVFSIRALKVAARAIATVGATAGTLKLGVNSGGTVNVDSGTVVSTGGQLVERYMATNPITSADWQQSEMNALQMNLRSA